MASPSHPPGHVEVASARSASEIRECVASTHQDRRTLGKERKELVGASEAIQVWGPILRKRE